MNNSFRIGPLAFELFEPYLWTLNLRIYRWWAGWAFEMPFANVFLVLGKEAFEVYSRGGPYISHEATSAQSNNESWIGLGVDWSFETDNELDEVALEESDQR